MKFRSTALLSVLLALVLASFVAMLPAPASAQSPYELSKITGFSQDITGADYDPIENILWVLTQELSGSNVLGRMVAVNATDDSIISTTLVYNSSGTNTQRMFGFSCNYPYCYSGIGGTAATATNGNILRFDITSTTPTHDTVLDRSILLSGVGEGLVTAAGSFGGSTLFVGTSLGSSTATTSQMWIMDGLYFNWTALGTPVTENWATTGSQAKNVADIAWSGLSAPNFDLAISYNSNGVNNVGVYSADTDVFTCTGAVGGASDVNGGVVIDHVDYGSFYVGKQSGTISVRSMSACTETYIIPATTTGLANTVFDMTIVDIGETKYLVARDVGTGGSISFMPWNGTHFDDYEFIVNSVPSSTQGNGGFSQHTTKNPTIGKIVNAFEVDKMFVPMTNTDRAVLVIDLGTPSGEGGIPGGFSGTVCVDFNGDDIIDSCYDSSEGVIDVPFADVPPLMDDIENYAPFFLASMTGIDGEAANILLGIIAPMGIIMMLGAVHKKVELPAFVFGIDRLPN